MLFTNNVTFKKVNMITTYLNRAIYFKEYMQYHNSISTITFYKWYIKREFQKMLFFKSFCYNDRYELALSELFRNFLLLDQQMYISCQ